MPVLRTVGVLALAASIVKPVALRIASSAERGALLVLIDRSRSMSIVENARSPAQLVAMADALGKLPAGARSDSATALAAERERRRRR